MKVLNVGEFKAKFSDVVKELLEGNEIVVSFGKKKEKIGVLVPYKTYKKKNKFKLGILEGKATFKIMKNFKMTEEELLDS